MQDEMPPKWMWHLDWELEVHFKLLKQKRERDRGGSSSDESSDYYEVENSLYDQAMQDLGRK